MFSLQTHVDISFNVKSESQFKLLIFNLLLNI